MSTDFPPADVSEVCAYMNEQMADTCVYLVRKLTPNSDAAAAKLVDISFTSATFEVAARNQLVEIPWSEQITGRSEVQSAFMALLQKAQSH